MLTLSLYLFVFAFIAGLVFKVVVAAVSFSEPTGVGGQMREAIKKAEAAKRERAAQERIARWKA